MMPFIVSHSWNAYFAPAYFKQSTTARHTLALFSFLREIMGTSGIGFPACVRDALFF